MKTKHVGRPTEDHALASLRRQRWTPVIQLRESPQLVATVKDALNERGYAVVSTPEFNRMIRKVAA